MSVVKVAGGMAMDISEKKLYTIEDIEALPEGKRAELFDGKMYMMASPTANHQRILSYLHGEFYMFMKEHEGKCEVFPAPFAVYLSKKHNYVEPDLVVICDEEKISEKGCNGAPDFVVEIVSMSSKRMDYALKLFKYRTEGVKEYWIVDEYKNRITVYDLERGYMEEYTFSDKVPVGLYNGELEIDFSEIALK